MIATGTIIISGVIDGRSIVSANVWYAISNIPKNTNGQEPADSAFTYDDFPNGNLTPGMYVWQATIITFSDGQPEVTGKMCLGATTDFLQGAEVYAVSQDSTTVPQTWVTSYTRLKGYYLWTATKVTYTNGHVDYLNPKCVGYWGEDGTSPWVADLSNEMDGVACDLEGHPTDVQGVRTTLLLSYGATQKNFGTPAVKRNGTAMTVNAATYTDGVRVVYSNKVLTVYYSKEATISDTDKYEITITADDDSSVVRTLTFSVLGARPGAEGKPATIYNILPSQSEIHATRNSDGTYVAQNATLVCGFAKNTGGTHTTILDVTEPFDGLKLYFRLHNRATNKWNDYLLYSSNKSQLNPLAVNTYDKAEFVIGSSLSYNGSVYTVNDIRDIETVNVVADGMDGTSPYLADIDNEHVSVACGADGRPVSETTLETTVSLWHGSTLQDITSVTVDGTAISTTAKTIGIFSVKYVAVETKKRKIQVTVGTTSVLPLTNSLAIEVSDGTETRNLSFVISGVRPGSDGKPATIYELLPSASFVELDGDGVPKFDQINFVCLKTVGNNAPQRLSFVKDWHAEGLTLWYQTADSEEVEVTEEYMGGSDQQVNFHDIEFLYGGDNTGNVLWILKKGDDILDYEGIGVVADGAPGANGTRLQRIYKSTNATPDTPTGNNPAGWSSTPTQISDGARYRWVSERKSDDDGVTWSAWSTPVIDAYLSEDGRSISIKGEAVAVIAWGEQLPDLNTTAVPDGSVFLMNNDDADDYNTLVDNTWEGATAVLGDGFLVAGHLWLKVRNVATSDVVRRWEDVGQIQGPQGPKGDDAIVCSLDNEHEDFLYTDSSTVNGGRISGVVTSQAHLRSGADDITEQANWTISSADGVVTNQASSPYYAAVSNVSGTKGLLTVKGINKTAAKVVVRAEYPVGSGRYYYADFTSNRKRQDKYNLVVNPAAISYNPASFVTTRIAISANVTTLSGETTQANIGIVATSPLQLWVLYGTTKLQLTQWYIDSATLIKYFFVDVTPAMATANEGITFELRKYNSGVTAYTVEDSETVEIARVQDGQDAPYDVVTYALYNSRAADTTTGAPTGTIYMGWQSVAPAPTSVYRYIWERIEHYEWEEQTATRKRTSYVCLTGPDGITGTRGKTGRFYYYDQDYDETKEYKIEQTQAPYVRYNGGFWMLDNGGTEPDSLPYSVTGVAPTGAAGNPWTQMSSEQQYYIARAFFGQNAYLGSFIINGDWMLSQYGTLIDVSGTKTIVDAANVNRQYNDKVPYAWFDATDPTASSNPQQDSYKFTPNFAVDGLTGATYQNKAYVRGEVYAESGVFNGTVYATSGEFTNGKFVNGIFSGNLYTPAVKITVDNFEQYHIQQTTAQYILKELGSLSLLYSYHPTGIMSLPYVEIMPNLGDFEGAEVRIVNAMAGRMRIGGLSVRENMQASGAFATWHNDYIPVLVFMGDVLTVRLVVADKPRWLIMGRERNYLGAYIGTNEKFIY